MAAVNASRLGPTLALLAVVACQGAPVDQGLTPAEATVVRSFLDCIDCVLLLDSVRALASRKPDPTVDSLNSGLLLGPGATAMRQADSVLKIGYRRDSLWRLANHKPPLDSLPIYLTDALGRYSDGYRSRGAIGMGWIHTPRAVAHLDSAATLPLPASVKQAVIFARDSLPPPR